MRFLVILLLAFAHSHCVHAQIHIRTNIAGYFTDQPKELIVMSQDALSGVDWEILNTEGDVVSNGTLSESAGGNNEYTTYAYNYQVVFSEVATSGIYLFRLPHINADATLIVSDNPVSFLPSELLQGFRVRRSCTADCLHHKISHVGDTACIIYRRNGSDNKDWQANTETKTANMIGGWYDAGDYLKFTHTIAYSCYLMAESYQRLPSLFDGQYRYSSSLLPDMLDELKFGLDYLLRCHPDSGEFIIQTGGYADHNEWPQRLPENDKLDGKRECYSALSPPQMGLAIAALSQGNIVFNAKDGYESFADSCLQLASTLFKIAKNQSTPSYFETATQTFYGDNSVDDNMALAAVSLYEATGNDTYLTEAEMYVVNMGTAGWASWGNVNLLALAKFAKLEPERQGLLNTELAAFQAIADKQGNVWRVPHKSTWATLFSYIAVANGALASEDDRYNQIAIDVIDFTLGKNSWGAQFIPTEKLRSAVSEVYATIYRLQPNIYPTGDIAEGPTDKKTLSANMQWFYPAHNDNLWHEAFNSANLAFYEEVGNYVCMETTIGGIAEALYLFTLATDKLGTEVSTDCNGEIGGNAITTDCTGCTHPIYEFQDCFTIETPSSTTTGIEDFYILEQSTGKLLTYRIINAEGVTVASGTSQYLIDVHNLQPGVYFITCPEIGLVKSFLKTE